jgi:hypothetical protein
MKSANAGTTMVGITMAGITMAGTKMAVTTMASTIMTGITMVSTGAHMYPNEARHPDCCSFLGVSSALPALPLVRSDLRTLAIVGQRSIILSRYI